MIGVNPSLAGKSVHGAAFFNNSWRMFLKPIDMVDIFRNSQVAGGKTRLMKRSRFIRDRR